MLTKYLRALHKSMMSDSKLSALLLFGKAGNYCVMSLNEYECDSDRKVQKLIPSGALPDVTRICKAGN